MEQKQNSKSASSVTAAVCATVFRPKDIEDNFRIICVKGEDGKVFSAKGEFGELADGLKLVLHGRWGKPFRGRETFDCGYVRADPADYRRRYAGISLKRDRDGLRPEPCCQDRRTFRG